MTSQRELVLLQLDDLCILQLNGPLAFGHQLEDLRSVKQEMARRNCTNLLVDISAIACLTSTEIGLLVGLYSSILGTANGRYVLVGPNPRVRRILDLTRLSSIIPIATDSASGLAILREQPALPRATVQSAS